ncbi:hypothetical protein [Lacipirellula sp.]|uniref:hypothetical protein n=1 Tax=Lacipirellula sp. TaxID=2691419 RepID=UPI003D11413F
MHNVTGGTTLPGKIKLFNAAIGKSPTLPFLQPAGTPPSMQSSDAGIPIYVRAIGEAFEALGCEIVLSQSDGDYVIKTSLPSSGRDEHAFLTLRNPSMDGSVHVEIELSGSTRLCLSDPQLIEILESYVVGRLR